MRCCTAASSRRWTAGQYHPIRRDLAAALLEQGDTAGARREAEAALRFRKRAPGTLALLGKLDQRSAAR